MNLNERIEAGRTNEVAKSFQAASEMIEKNTMDGAATAIYPNPMGVAPKNSELGRVKSAELRSCLSQQHDVRLTIAITEAAMGGANRLERLVSALTEANVSTRRGGPWSVRLASIEMVRIGHSIKSLHSRFQPKPVLSRTYPLSTNFVVELNLVPNAKFKLQLRKPSEAKAKEILSSAGSVQYRNIDALSVNLFKKNINIKQKIEKRSRRLIKRVEHKLRKISRSTSFTVITNGSGVSHTPYEVLSAPSYDKMMAEEERIAQEFGLWVPLVFIPPARRIRWGTPIKHKDYGIGDIIDESDCYCRFVNSDFQYEFTKARAVDVAIFFWDDREAERNTAIEALRSNTKRMPLVPPSSLTEVERAMRATATQWLVGKAVVCPKNLREHAKPARPDADGPSLS